MMNSWRVPDVRFRSWMATVCIIAAGFGPGGLSLAVDQLGARSAALEKSIAAAAEPFLSEPHLFYPATYFPVRRIEGRLGAACLGIWSRLQFSGVHQPQRGNGRRRTVWQD